MNKTDRKQSKTVILGSDLTGLSDAQIIAWYSKHPHPTVRAIVTRLAFNNEQHKEAVLEAYQKGIEDTQRLDPAPHGMSESELAYAARMGVRFQHEED